MELSQGEDNMRKIISFTLIVAVVISTLSLSACSNITDPITPKETEETTVTSKETEPASLTTETETEPSEETDATEYSDPSVMPLISDSIYPLRQRVMEAVAFMAQEGMTKVDDLCYLTFTYKPDGAHPSEKLEEVDPRTLPYEDGNLKIDLNLLCFPIDRNSEYTYQVSMICMINGKVYDFKLGDKKSGNGVLVMDLDADTDFLESLDISGIPVNKGNNSFCFMSSFYCPQQDRYFHTNVINGKFVSESEVSGNSPIDLATEDQIKGIEIKSTEGLTDSEKIYPSFPLKLVDNSDILKMMDEESDVLTVKTKATITKQILNTNNEFGPSNRSGILMVFNGGKLIPVFAGKEMMYVSLNDDCLLKSVPLDKVFKAGDTTNLNLKYVEFENDSEIGSIDVMEDQIRILFKD